MRIRGTLSYIKEVNANFHFHKMKRSGPKMKIMSCVTSFDHVIRSYTGQNIYPLDTYINAFLVINDQILVSKRPIPS